MADIPDRMRRLPLDPKRGHVVPWFVDRRVVRRGRGGHPMNLTESAAYHEALNDVARLTAERDAARAEAAQLRAVLALDPEIGEGDRVTLILRHALVEQIGDMVDGLPVVTVGHPSVAEDITVTLTEYVALLPELVSAEEIAALRRTVLRARLAVRDTDMPAATRKTLLALLDGV